MLCVPPQTKQMEDYEVDISEDSDDSTFEEDYPVEAERFHLEKDKRNSSSLTDSLEKVGRFLFAEDLVSYVALEFHNITYVPKIKKDSDLLYNPFNEVVRCAVHFIRWRINKVKCPSFEIIRKLSTSHTLYYECFVDAILSRYSESGLKAGMFLFYCVYFAELASRCYKTEFEEILDFAVYAILDAFCTLSEGRYELNRIAKNFISMSENGSFYGDYKSLLYTPSENFGRQDETFKESSIQMCFYSQENQLEKMQTRLEHLKLADEVEKSEVICNSDLSMVEDTEPKSKSLEYGGKVADNSSFLSRRDNTISFTDKEGVVEYETSPFSLKIQQFEDFALEITSVASFEASLFCAIYLSYENQTNLDQQEDTHTENDKEYVELTKCLNRSNSELKGPGIENELNSQCFVYGEAKNITQPVKSDLVSIQQDDESKSEDSGDISDYGDLQLPNAQSKALEFMQDQLLSQNLAYNKAETLNTQIVEHFTHLQYEKSTTNSDISDHSTIVPTCETDPQIGMFLAVYKREGEASAENLVVLKGDSLLFAEDFVRRVAKEFYNIAFPESKLEENRDLLHNAFNEAVTEAIHYIRGEIETVNEVIFDLIANVKEHPTDYYRKYVAAILSHYTLDGLNSDVFLYYCLHFSELAMKCCSFDPSNMLDFAVCSILDAFCLLKHDWNEFNTTAEKIVRISKDCATKKNCNHQQDQVILCPTKDSDNFESECLTLILSSLKDIHGLCTKLKENKFIGLKQKVEAMLMNFETINYTQTSEIDNTNDIFEQNEITKEKQNEQISEKVVNSTNSSSASEVKYQQDLTLEVCSIISFEAAKLAKDILS